MSRLGSSLLELILSAGGKFSLKTVLLLADQMLPALEALHGAGYVHRDFKPDNLLMGHVGEESRLFIVDLGMAEALPQPGDHISGEKGSDFTGNVYWASTNLLRRMPPSCRDDLESCFYVLLFLSRGELPWQRVRGSRLRVQRILALRESLAPKDICCCLPPAFRAVLEYIRGLRFCEHPNYEWIKGQFREAATALEIVYDFRFDWKEAAQRRGRSESDVVFLEGETDVLAPLDATSEGTSACTSVEICLKRGTSRRKTDRCSSKGCSSSLLCAEDQPAQSSPTRFVASGSSAACKQIAALERNFLVSPGSLLDLHSHQNSAEDQDRPKAAQSCTVVFGRKSQRKARSKTKIDLQDASLCAGQDSDSTPKGKPPTFSQEFRKRWKLLV